jgi:hypothetical protein
MDNKYSLTFSPKTLSAYYKKLIDSYYILLPLYEGLDHKTKQVIYKSEKAHEMYLDYLGNFIHEICGGYMLFNESEHFLTLLTSLESMTTFGLNEKKKLKSLVFKCIDILKKLERGCQNEILSSINTHSDNS